MQIHAPAKGAAASAIYGARAANGVVLITTKKGTPGTAKWDLTGKVGTFTPGNTLNLRQFPTMASAEAWYNKYCPCAGAATGRGRTTLPSKTGATKR